MHNVPVVLQSKSNKSAPQKNLLWDCQDIKNFQQKKFASDEAFVEMESTVLQYTQLAKITFMKYASNLSAKSCIETDVYDASTLTDKLNRWVKLSVFHRL